MAGYFADEKTDNTKNATAKKTAPARSIRNIEVTRPRGAKKPTRVATDTTGAGTVAMPPNRIWPKKLMVWIIAIASIAFLALAAVFTFQNTKVAVTPREHTVVFDENATFTAYATGDENMPAGALEYTVFESSLDDEVTVPASGTETVSERASGKLVVYNNHSSGSVRLIKNTRFQTPAGLVYRARESFVIPGKKGGVPGNVTITVYADETGERYNIGPVEKFTLPGLKATAPELFSDIYARSDTSMGGGFEGERPVVSDSDMDKARDQLRARLTERIESEIAGGEARYVFSGTFASVFESLSTQSGDDSSAVVRERVIVKAPAFEKSEFAKSLARAMSADAGDGDISIFDSSTFDAALLETFDSDSSSPIDISFSGTAHFVWSVDAEALARDLTGKSADLFDQIVASHVGVEEAEAKIRPFWSSKFPDGVERIDVAVEDVVSEE